MPTNFDESGWRALTRWDSADPSPAEIWRALNASGVSEFFRDRLNSHLGASELLQAGFVQALQAEGKSREDILPMARAAFGSKIRPATLDKRLAATAKRAEWKIAFANLVSGRFTEMAFAAAFTEPLADVGLILVEAVSDRSFLDFRIMAQDESESFELAINVKNAGRQMAKAEEFFGLQPEDTIPMATYKAFGSTDASIAPLIYAYLIDWDLLERLRASYWNALSDNEATVFRILTSFKGLSRDLEDDFITATVDERIGDLRQAVGYEGSGDLNFRAISAARCQSIFYENHRRSPYVFIRRMNTDPNVHISVSAETIAFTDVVERHLSDPDARRELLAGLAKERQLDIPDPPL